MSGARAVRVEWLGGYRTEVDIRGVHRLQSDETVASGGEDSGPMPTELLLSAVGTCMCLAVTHLAGKRRIELGRVSVDARAVKDMQEFRFHEIHLEVEADLAASDLEKLVDRAKSYCFVSNTLIEGCAVHVATRALAAEDESR